MLYLWVALGSAGGGVLRYALDLWARNHIAREAPWGTLAANLIGSFAIGVVTASVRDPALRSVLMAGVLGGFTTFSTLSLQTVQYAQDGRWTLALGYPLISLLGGVLGCLAGMALAGGLRRD